MMLNHKLIFNPENQQLEFLTHLCFVATFHVANYENLKASFIMSMFVLYLPLLGFLTFAVINHLCAAETRTESYAGQLLSMTLL